MSITVRKVSDAIAKGGKTVLRPPRAVSVAEAPYIQPAQHSTTTTMMPWKGWFQRFLKDTMGDKHFATWKNYWYFMPDDVYDGQHSPMPSVKVPISATDPTLTHQYRYPSPGNQPLPVLPEFDEGEDPYDSGYFKRDTARRYMSSEFNDPALDKLRLEMMGAGDDPDELAKLKPESSPGNGGRFATGPSDFDPSGLRATMSVTWEAVEKSLDEHMPDHLPTPVWEGHEAEIIQWHEERDLPVPVGGYFADLKVPTERRIATW